MLVRLGGLGDVLFTLPAVNAVRAACPGCHITFLVYTQFAPLLEGFRGVDAVLALDREGYKRGNVKFIVCETLSLLRQLRRGAFDLVVDFQGFGETALLAWCSGAAHRWGSVYRPARRWAYTRGVRRNTRLHPIDYQLELLREAGQFEAGPPRNEFGLPAHALHEARQFFFEHGLEPARPTLFIQPFSNAAHKDWTISGYLETAGYWRQHGLQVLFGGGPQEKDRLEPMRAAGFVVAAGTPLMVSAGLADLSTVVLGGDTGLLHLAVALGKRVVMLMGSVEPGSCYPYGHPEWAVVPAKEQPVSSLAIERVNAACAMAVADAGNSTKCEVQPAVQAPA